MKSCPKCQHSPLDYHGLSKNPGGQELFPTYRCGKCNRVFADMVVRNPSPAKDGQLDGQRLPKAYGEAIKLFENFNFKKADKIVTANISLPDNNKNPLVYLGQISELTYISSKEGKENQRYTHDLDAQFPTFFVTADGKTFIIAGGKIKVSDWLYH